MYRLKEAFIIFWCVLTHRYYCFASVRRWKREKKQARLYYSAPAEDFLPFWETLAIFTENRIIKIKER